MPRRAQHAQQTPLSGDATSMTAIAPARYTTRPHRTINGDAIGGRPAGAAAGDAGAAATASKSTRTAAAPAESELGERDEQQPLAQHRRPAAQDPRRRQDDERHDRALHDPGGHHFAPPFRRRCSRSSASISASSDAVGGRVSKSDATSATESPPNTRLTSRFRIGLTVVDCLRVAA